MTLKQLVALYDAKAAALAALTARRSRGRFLLYCAINELIAVIEKRGRRGVIARNDGTT